MIAILFDILSSALILYDLLSHVVYFKTYSDENKKTDYSRLIKTFSFFVLFKVLGQLSYSENCKYSQFVYLIFSIAALLVSIPKSTISDLLTKKIYEEKVYLDLIEKGKQCLSQIKLDELCSKFTSCGNKTNDGKKNK